MRRRLGPVAVLSFTLLAFTLLAFTLLAGGLLAGEASAGRREAPAEGARKVQGVRTWAYEYLEKAHEALDQERYDDALAALAQLERKDRRMNDHERSLLWQSRAYVYSAQEQYDEAIENFRRCVDADAMPEASLQNARYNLGQLYLVTERYDDAIRTLVAWFQHARNPSANAHFMMAMAYLQVDDKAQALVHARETVAGRSEPREPWLQLLASLLIDAEEFEDAVPVLEQLSAAHPKKSYFTQLSALYSHLGRHERALGTLEVAYLQNLLDDESNLETLAQLYLYNDVPYKAAKVLETGLEAGRIAGDEEAWRLLGTAWLQAKERDRAMPPLERAATLQRDGDGWMQLARIQLEAGEWASARASLGRALGGGVQSPGTAQLLLGIANASEERWEDARRAFEAAGEHPPTRAAAEQWLGSIRSYLKPDEPAAEPDEGAPVRQATAPASTASSSGS
jgi:tetratricopeptide (TPR) repeat protein